MGKVMCTRSRWMELIHGPYLIVVAGFKRDGDVCGVML